LRINATTYLVSVSIRKKISIADMPICIAGGVALDQTCADAKPSVAVFIGVMPADFQLLVSP